MRCEKCGKEIPENAKFCRFCGAKAETAAIKPETSFCSVCGAKIAKNAKFCNKCGAEIGAKVDIATPVAIPVNEPVTSVTISDEAPVTNKADSTAPAKRSTQASGQVKRVANAAFKEVIAGLTDGDYTAIGTPGEMKLPVTEAQSMFMKLISKEIPGDDGT